MVLRFLYLEDIPKDLVDARSTSTEEEVLEGIDKISKQLEIDRLWEAMLSGNDRRLARQRYQDEVERARSQVEAFFQERVLGYKMVVDSDKVSEIKWPRDNSIFADCLLRADEPGDTGTDGSEEITALPTPGLERSNSIPIGPAADVTETQPNTVRPKKRSTVFPAHKAMLIRSPYFETMFSSKFREARDSEHLHVITVDCTPEVLEIILTFLYTEKIDCPLELALDLLYTADMLFLDKLKNKAAVAISSLGSGNDNVLVDRTHGPTTREDLSVKDQPEMEPINIYDVIHAAWDLRVQRLEEFSARYLAYRLEDYIDEPEFAELIRESAGRLKSREETDTIELLDDIRYYLSDRFRLRFEDAGIEGLLDEDGELSSEVTQALSARAAIGGEEIGEQTHRQDQGRDKGLDSGGVKTLDGGVVEDEFVSDAINYQILLQKIDVMLDHLKLDA